MEQVRIREEQGKIMQRTLSSDYRQEPDIEGLSAQVVSAARV